MAITQQDLDRYMAPRAGGAAPTLQIPAPVQAAQVSTPLQDASRQVAVDTFERDQDLAATPISKTLTAAVQNWDTTQLYNAAFNKPQFQDDPQFNKAEALQQVQFPVSADQRDFLFKSKSQDEFNWRTSQLKDMQDRAQLAQASPILNTIVQFADPLYLAADMLSAGAATALKVGRLGTLAMGAASTVGIQTAVNDEVRPVSAEEVIMAAAMHGAASVIGYRAPTKSLADMSPEEFAAEMQRRNAGAPAADPNAMGSPLVMAGTFNPNAAAAGVVEEVPAAIQQVAKEGFDNAKAGVVSQPKRPWAEVSLFKTMSSYGPEGQATASRLLDDPLNPNMDSVASIHREVSARFSTPLHQYEDTVLNSLQQQGWGAIKRFRDPQGFRRAQQDFESQVRMELDQRMVDPAYRGGNPAVAQATDRLGEYSRTVGKEMERNGMVDSGFTEANPYYYPRRMNVANVERMETAIGKKAFMKQMTTAVQKGVGTDRPTANAIAYAMVERARRKGYGIDNSGHIINKEGRDELLDIIKQAPDLTDEAKARASALLADNSADAGRPPMLKSRINIDMMHQIAPGMQVRDLFDDSISSMMDSYNRRISGRIALHNAGLGEPGAMNEMRTKLSQSIRSPEERTKALQNFDNIVAYYNGAPVGEQMPKFMRDLSALTQATGLASSGLWQLVEYGTMMQRYGAVKTFRAMLRTIPESRALMQQLRTNTKEGKQLALDMEEALTAQVASDIRMRPVMDHYDDMFAADKSPWVMRLEQARDATMYINMQKYIHFHQTRVNAALVMQTLRKASEGDAKAIKAMKSYGASDQLLSDINTQTGKHGMATDKWDEGVFNRTRTVLINSMDDAIVRARLGELPAFAEFSTLGKFLFTFRRFVAATHNKTLVGTFNKDGARGLATLMAYQFPLAMFATAANNVISGKGFDDKAPITSLAGQAINYMGAIGFASEFTGVLSGQQRSFGAPGLLFLDRVYGIGGNVASAGKHAVTGDTDKLGNDLRQATGNTLAAVPLLSIVPGVRALTNAVKDQ